MEYLNYTSSVGLQIVNGISYPICKSFGQIVTKFF